MNAVALAFIAVSKVFSLPVGVLSSMCYVESGHSINIVHKNDGDSDSIGICQVKMETAKMLGFKGTEKQLLNYRINIYYAGKYLRYQLNRYNNIDHAICAYNSGSFKRNKKAKYYLFQVTEAWVEGR